MALNEDKRELSPISLKTNASIDSVEYEFIKKMYQ
jgi:hypothetical protein